MKYLMILALLAACSGDETVSGHVDNDTAFTLDTLDGIPFTAPATIQFPGEGKVLGEGPCNRWSAPQSRPYPWVKIGPIAATKRACPYLNREQEFFTALAEMSLVESTGNVVILTNDAGREMVFRAQN